MMDRLIIERIGFLEMYRVSYNGVSLCVPWFRGDSAIKRVTRCYHGAKGVGR